MKKLWALLLIIASITWAQETDVTVKVTSTEWIWPDELKAENLPPLANIGIKDIAVNDSGWIFLASMADLGGKYSYVWRSKDLGNTWEQLRNFDAPILFGDVWAIATIDSNYLLAGSWNDIFRSTDNGETWKKIEGPNPEDDIAPRNFLVRKSDNAIFCASAGDGVFVSYDNGLSWEKRSNGIEWPLINSITLNSNNFLFAGSWSSQSDKATGIWRSGDEGLSWVQVNNGLTNLTIKSLTSSPDGFVYATTESYGVNGKKDAIFKTVDNGENWVLLSDDFKNPEVIYYSDKLNLLFVGYYDRLLYSNDNGISWSSVQELNGQAVMSFAQLDSLNLLVGTWDGVWLITFEIITDISNDPQNPNEFSLSQNYPNPFNPSTKIKYTIPKVNFVTLKIYDVLGKEIATLVNEEKSAGTYEVEFNAKGLSSGMYFYKIESGNFVQIKKMILLK